MNMPLPPVSSFAILAAGPDGRGWVVAVDAAVVVVLAVDGPLLLLEHAASATTAPTTMLTVSPLVRVRTEPLRSQIDERRHATRRQEPPAEIDRDPVGRSEQPFEHHRPLEKTVEGVIGREPD